MFDTKTNDCNEHFYTEDSLHILVKPENEEIFIASLKLLVFFCNFICFCKWGE